MNDLSATARCCTPILTSIPTPFCGTLSPTRPPKPKILWSPKSLKFASGARKDNLHKHLPSTTLHRFSTSQSHHTFANSLKPTRLSGLYYTRPKHCLQSVPINTILVCDAYSRPSAFCAPTTLKPIPLHLQTHTPTPTPTPNTVRVGHSVKEDQL